MATPAQLAANVANAAFSTGPRTEAGKEASRSNALLHGLTARKLVLAQEDEEAFLALQQSTLAHYRPANELERTLTVRVAETLWRSMRTDRLHDTFIADRISAIQDRNPETRGSDDTAAVAMLVDPAEQKRFTLMLRYVNAAHREHRKAVAELQKVQTTRKQQQQEQALREAIQDELVQTEALAASSPVQGCSTFGSSTFGSSGFGSSATAGLSRQQRRALMRAEQKAANRAKAA